MHSLTITKQNDRYVVETENFLHERNNFEDILCNTLYQRLCDEQMYLEAINLVSALFRVLGAVRVSVGGVGEWWFAEAEIQRVPSRLVDAEGIDPNSVLRELIVEIVKEDDRLIV